MNIVTDIEEAWGWVGIRPEEIVGENDFGNLMIRDVQGHYWRLTPEDLSCEVIAQTRAELDRLSVDQEFLGDWYMRPLVEKAREQCGPLPEGRKYCLKIPAALGGEYDGDNLATISLVELIRASGHLARQIKDLPDGAKVSLRVTE
jgi:hypothetical protein